MARLNRFGALLAASLVGLGGAAVWEGVQYYQIARHNRELTRIDTLQPDEQATPALLAAKAYHHVQQGQLQPALHLYTRALSQAKGGIRQKLAYNLGTLYLREAAHHWNRQGVWAYSRVITLLGLARNHLRDAVRLDPDDLDARYNLEYALRITPPPREREPAKWEGNKASVFATLPGLPRGGP